MPVPQTKDPEEDPGAALGETLKELRLAAGFTTLAAVGDRLGYSKDSIGKAETGAHVPTLDMLVLMLDLYKPPEILRKSVLRQHAFARKVKGPIPQFFELYLKREAAATFLRLWALDVLPGLLQTYDYANAMFMAVGMDEDEAAEKAAARKDRRTNLEGPNAKQVTAVIYEPVLYCRVGTPEIMAGQLEDLLEVSRRSNVVIQVVRENGYFPGRRGQFEIASGHGIPDTLVMYNVEDQTQDDEALVSKAAALFERIRGFALPVEESQAIIREALKQCKSQQQ